MNKAQRKRLDELTDEQVYCLGEGRHDFPPVIPGRPLPRGCRVERDQGIYQLIRTCRICSRELTACHGRNGVRDYDTASGYKGGGKGYDAEPGLGMTRGMYRDERDARQAVTIVEAEKLARRQAADPEYQQTQQQIAELRGRRPVARTPATTGVK